MISQEKMGDNIKKVANLFVISDFCSIYYCNNDKKSQPFRRRRLAFLVFTWEDNPYNPLNFSVLCHFLQIFFRVPIFLRIFAPISNVEL